MVITSLFPPAVTRLTCGGRTGACEEGAAEVVGTSTRLFGLTGSRVNLGTSAAAAMAAVEGGGTADFPQAGTLGSKDTMCWGIFWLGGKLRRYCRC